MAQIEKIEKDRSDLKIKWSDGEESKFNYMWLRDNCPTAHDKDSHQRMFNILNVSKNLSIKDFKINESGSLQVQWSEGDHTSYYDPNWLRSNCYTLKNKSKYVSPYDLWDKDLKSEFETICVEHDEILETDEGLIKWLKLLHHKGVAIIKNAPVEKKSAFPLLNRISHVRETFFGTPFEVINIPKPNNQAYTADALTSHTDLPYYEYAPGYQFLHCLVNDAEGGISTCLDGFNIANFLKKNDSKIFDLLINTSVKFNDNDYTQNKIHIHHSPIVNLSENGDFNDIRFNMGAMGILDISPELMEGFYKAYRKFASLLKSNQYLIKFKLKAGDIFCFNNRRVLHGRTKFNPSSGHRHLQGYYIDRDEILSRLNFLKKN